MPERTFLDPYTVGSYEAKTHLSRLLRRVAKGQQIIITKHGVPVARLVPMPTAAPSSPWQKSWHGLPAHVSTGKMPGPRCGRRLSPRAARPQVGEVIEAIKQFRKGNRLDGRSIRAMIDEGRRLSSA